MVVCARVRGEEPDAGECREANADRRHQRLRRFLGVLRLAAAPRIAAACCRGVSTIPRRQAAAILGAAASCRTPSVRAPVTTSLNSRIRCNAVLLAEDYRWSSAREFVRQMRGS